MEAPDDGAYRYAHLPGTRWIRLLRLLPGRTEGLLSATLTQHELEGDVIAYTSLSYSWGRDIDGDASLSRQIWIAGRSLAITENLHDFLLRCVPTQDGECAPFWIDAVCINQTDVEERNAQVAMMAEIYSLASEMIIWLGNDADQETDDAVAVSHARLARHRLNYADDNRMLEVLDPKQHGMSVSPIRLTALRLGQYLTKRYARTVRLPQHRQFYHRLLEPRTTRKIIRFALEATVHEPSYADILMADIHVVDHLARRRYFSRRWVVQEIFHSVGKPVSVHWGSHHLKLATFRELLDLAWSSRTALLTNRHLPQSLRDRVRNETDTDFTTFKARSCFRTHIHLREDASSILEIIDELYHMRCSDDRDRLFAILSLAARPIMRADYSLSVAQTYVSFAQNLARSGHTVDILMVASLQYHPNRLENRRSLENELPSWVPDLRIIADFHGGWQQCLLDAVVTENSLTLTASIRPVSPPWTDEEVSFGLRVGDCTCRLVRKLKFELFLRPLQLRENACQSFRVIGGRFTSTLSDVDAAKMQVQSITLW